MQTKLKKTILAALPVAGLLFTAPAVFAHGSEYRDYSSRYQRYHDSRRDHCDFHNDRARRAWHRRHNDQNSYSNRRYSDWNRGYSGRYLGGYNGGEAYDSFWDRRADEWN